MLHHGSLHCSVFIISPEAPLSARWTSWSNTAPLTGPQREKANQPKLVWRLVVLIVGLLCWSRERERELATGKELPKCSRTSCAAVLLVLPARCWSPACSVPAGQRRGNQTAAAARQLNIAREERSALPACYRSPARPPRPAMPGLGITLSLLLTAHACLGQYVSSITLTHLP